jgi:predicted AAA+ superfamily ATPase
MPHQRKRHAEVRIQKLAKFWPIVGVLGMRQVGKSTILRDRLQIENYLTLDNEDTRREAETSVQTFIGRNETMSTVIDEVQKVPKLFDAIKAQVDRRKRPGQWYLSGSVAFSGKIGIRESLTGRIGLTHLYPMGLSELHSKEILGWSPKIYLENELHKDKCRFRSDEIASQMELGGLPVPAFIRKPELREQYWQSWFETTIVRDAAKAFGRGFDAEKCMGVVRQLALALRDGEYPSLEYVTIDKRVAKKYITALESIFFLRRISIYDLGIGKDHWIFGDSGLAFFLSGEIRGPSITLALARHYILNEIFSYYEYHGHPIPRLYYKSSRSSIVDLVIKDIPIKIIAEGISPTKMGWHERPLLGAMKKLGATTGLIVAPVDYIHLPKKGVGIVPWSYWS